MHFVFWQCKYKTTEETEEQTEAAEVDLRSSFLFSIIEFMEDNLVTGQVIGLAMEIHKALGPGLLESAHKECLAYKLE